MTGQGPGTATFGEAEEAVLAGGEVWRVPALVKGRLVLPADLPAESLRSAAPDGPGPTGGRQSFRVEGAHVIRRPLFDRRTLEPAAEERFLVLPDVDPRALVETDLGELARGLYRLPFREVVAYAGALREALTDLGPALEAVAQRAKAASPVHDRALDVLFEVLPELLDPQGLAEAVDRELGSDGIPGTHFLDGWVGVPAAGHRGATARMRDAIFRAPGDGAGSGPRVRAMPTRQLHVTAGNAPVVPFVSILRALATKGAAVVKSPAESTESATILALAMSRVDPEGRHPITRHTSLVYWPGGDRRIEDVLFAPGSFDRLVVWGSPETVESVRARAGTAKTVFLNPRFGVSLIGREAFRDGLEAVAVRASCDSLIENQAACTSSLVHYVEASEEDALAYCRTLKEVLARWDLALPHRLSRAALGRLRRLRRGELVGGAWFENGPWPQTTSLVVYMPTEFDLSVHPMCRCVVVRRVDELREALAFVHAGVSAAGVYPEARREDLLDELAARGVSNVFPLGECERSYAGMPHDGMRVLSELVNWTSA